MIKNNHDIESLQVMLIKMIEDRMLSEDDYNLITKYLDKLKNDLNKSQFESYMSEIGMVLSDLNYAKKKVRRWTKDKRVLTPISQFHAKSFIKKELMISLNLVIITTVNVFMMT